ncbi:hypothetical protein GCM10009775_00740 [Microbacterium aoyamense]|uniref:Uncharacterized protein n=1 Tax=Microbacterium aoyamense TaxID=344166 RepID=A0ABN2P5X4_9MICO|nr:hypothetical protein [Microbacterium aoyamense]
MVTLPHPSVVSRLRVAPLRARGLPRLSKTILLFCVASAALAGTVAINVAQTEAQPHRMTHLGELDGQLAGLRQHMTDTRSATERTNARAADLRALIAEQDALFADTTGFIE